MERKQKWYVPAMWITLAINALFWIGLGLFYIITQNQYWFVSILLLLDAVLYGGLLLLYKPNRRIITGLCMGLGACNAILSLTDQIGLLDVISFVFSIAVMGIGFYSLVVTAKRDQTR